MPAYHVAGWTVTWVAPATACPFASVAVALMVNACVPSPSSIAAGTSKRATPEASVRVSPPARSGSR